MEWNARTVTKFNFNIAQNRERFTAIGSSESDDNEDNIYISDKENIINNELIVYVEKKRANKKVSLFFILFLYISYIFLTKIC